MKIMRETNQMHNHVFLIFFFNAHHFQAQLMPNVLMMMILVEMMMWFKMNYDSKYEYYNI